MTYDLNGQTQHIGAEIGRRRTSTKDVRLRRWYRCLSDLEYSSLAVESAEIGTPRINATSLSSWRYEVCVTYTA